ncbi:MAG: hypothetical protein ABSA09_06975 [Desulfobaccales bacterium]|jgi:hypothetical protein
MRLFKPKTIPGWLLIAFWFCWEFLGAWARIEFVFKKAWPGKPMIPIFATIAQSRWFSITILVAGLAWIWWSTRPKSIEKKEGLRPERLPVIEILSHKNGRDVQYREKVSGTISMPNSSMQVLVHAGNDRWYLQRNVVVRDNSWEVECYFGDEGSPSGSSYEIVAISPAQKIASIIDTLPSNVTKSEFITGYRA